MFDSLPFSINPGGNGRIMAAFFMLARAAADFGFPLLAALIFFLVSSGSTARHPAPVLLDSILFLLCSSLCLRPSIANRFFSLDSTDRFLPIWESQFRLLISGSAILLINASRVFCFASSDLFSHDFRDLRFDSSECLYPDIPSPPSVLLRRQPVPTSSRPYWWINSISAWNASGSFMSLAARTTLAGLVGIGAVRYCLVRILTPFLYRYSRVFRPYLDPSLFHAGTCKRNSYS